MAARRLNYSLSKITQRYSTTSRSKINEIPTDDGNLALVSLSNDVYYNLALEQYIADNYDFDKRNMMFLWRNEPCVVLGRYQNAWYEANLVEMKNRNVKLSRRPSGGGTVYHGILPSIFF
jgi:lipoate-protein ligase A